MRLLPQAIPEKRQQVYADRLAKLPKAPVDVLVMGDQLTARWPGPALNAVFDGCSLIKVAMSSDVYRHTLWKIRGGHFDALRPRIVVLALGNNNLARGDPGEDIALGITTVVEEIVRRWAPQVVFVVGIPPRGESGAFNADQRAEANQKLRGALAAMPQVRYLDIDGVTAHPGSYQEDWTHLSEGGYEWLSTALLEMYESLGPLKQEQRVQFQRRPSWLRRRLDSLVAKVP
jgi:hypothetical protein